MNARVTLTRRQFGRLMAAASLSPAALAAAPGSGIRRIHTKGVPFERGRQQAAAGKDLFLPWHKAWLEKQAAQRRLSIRQLVEGSRSKLLRWRDHLGKAWPEGLEEIGGLIAGLEVDELEFHLAHLTPDLSELLRNCTVIGVRDSAGRPLVSKTDDIGRHELGMNILEITHPRQGMPHVHFHFAGTIWTVAGMNEAGLSMGMNGIPGKAVDRPGIPALLALHTILPACSSVQAAIEHIRSLPINGGGFSLLLGDAQGEMAVVERTAAGTAVLPEIPGAALVHANHILDPEFARLNPPAVEPILSNSLGRQRNAERLARQGASLEKIVNDRNAEGAICQRGEADMFTDFSVIFSPVEKKFTLFSGHPGPVREERLGLTGLLQS